MSSNGKAVKLNAALVTGASRGIGRALAREFAAHGHDLVLVARNEPELNAVAEEIRATHGVTTKVMVADLAQPDTPDQVFSRLESEGPPIDILVNNAGFGIYGKFLDADWREDRDLLQVNIVALTHLTKRFAKPMVARGRGRILNVASTGAFQPGPLMTTYYASKAYVLSFSEALNNELEGTGVTATALCPGVTASNFQERARMHDARIVQGKLMTMMDAETVARVGYRGSMRGKPIVIPGFMNRALAFAVRLSPRAVVTKIVRQMMESP